GGVALQVQPRRLADGGLADRLTVLIGCVEFLDCRLFVNLHESDAPEARRLTRGLFPNADRPAGGTACPDLGSAERSWQVVGLESVGLWRQRHLGKA
ncbi:MAG: hypothetical protein M3O77_07465, partial [Chloroflexota bacterium]|nr:hypothetical protein [Chloroflexota bacterium]